MVFINFPSSNTENWIHLFGVNANYGTNSTETELVFMGTIWNLEHANQIKNLCAGIPEKNSSGNDEKRLCANYE